MKENQRQAEQSQPNMAAQPGLRATQPPDRDLLARAEQASVQHHRVSGDAERQADRATAARSAGGTNGINDIDDRARHRRRDGRDDPRTMGSIDAHVRSSVRAADPAEKFVRLHAMRGIMRAGVDATRLGLIGA